MFRHLLIPVVVLVASCINVQPQTLEPLEIEHHIPSSVSKGCTVVIFVNTLTAFNPITDRPVMILTKDHEELVLRQHCNVLVFPDFKSTSKNMDEFMLKNKINTALLLVYSTPQKPVTIKEVRTHIRVLQVVLVDVLSNTSKLYKYPINCHGSLKCLMKRRRLRIGYSSVRPHFGMFGWDKRKALNQPIAPFIVNQSNPVSKYFSGIEADVLDLLVDRYEMSFEMITTPDFLYGNKTANGSWNGKYGLLQRNQVDLVMGLVSANQERKELGSYSAYMYVTDFMLCSLKPPVRHNFYAALRPFPILGWAILGVSIFLVAPVTWFVTKQHRRLLHITNLKEGNLLMYFGHATATLLVEPWPKPPGGPASLLLVAWFIGCLVLQCIYASNFTVSLSFPDVEPPINALHDAWSQNKRVMVTSGSTIDSYLKDSKDPMIRDIYKKRYVTVLQSDDELFHRLNIGLVSTINGGVFYDRLSKLGPAANDYHVSTDPILRNFGSWLFKEDGTYMAPEINLVILRAAEVGLLKKWDDDMIRRMSTRFRKKRSAFAESIQLALSEKDMPLSFGHLEGVFVFWIIGVGLSILTFAYELTCKPVSAVGKAVLLKRAQRKYMEKFNYLR